MDERPPRPLTNAERAEGYEWQLIEDEWELLRPFRPGDEQHPLLRDLQNFSSSA